MHRLEITRGAQRTLERLPRPIRHRLGSAIAALAHTPRPPGCVKLEGLEHTWRIRVGAYRVIYEIRDEVLLVIVIRVGHRREVYR